MLNLTPDEKNFLLLLLINGGAMSDALLPDQPSLSETIRSLRKAGLIIRSVHRYTQDSVTCISPAGYAYVSDNIMLW
jgi:DNA-binding MarR family transcriptional regulator